MTFEQVKALLAEHGQEHLLQYYDELSTDEQSLLLSTIADMDWSFEEELKNPADLTGAGRDIKPIKGMDLPEIEARTAEFEAIGIEAIKQGKVAAVLLAGGMGTRLGVDGPKGAYDIGVTKPLYIFEQQMKNVMEVVNKVGVYVPMYIMTSDKNHEATTSFWAEHNYFGYPADLVKFFKQDMAPAVDYDGKIIM